MLTTISDEALECSSWFIWVIRQGKFNIVEAYLKEIPEIEEILYPTTTKFFQSKAGTSKRKRYPLYSGYLFLKYRHTPEVYHKINGNPFVTTYVGPCRAKDLDIVKQVRELEYINTINKDIEVNDTIKITSGPFRDFTGIVVEVTSRCIVAQISVFGRLTRTTINKDDVDVVKR